MSHLRDVSLYVRSFALSFERCNDGMHTCGLVQWFSEVDSNGDGFIDAKELEIVLRKATFKFDNSGIAAQMIRSDTLTVSS